MRRIKNLENAIYNQKYKKIYKLLFTADLDEVSDHSNWYKTNKNFVEIKRPLWIIVESKILNKRIWITHDFGRLGIDTAQLDLDCKSSEYHNSYEWKDFKNQKEMVEYLEKLLEPCLLENNITNEIEDNEEGGFIKMSSELINRISIKKDGVYVSTHSNNDTSPYHSVRVDFLSKAYEENGQRGLDKEIINMCFYNCQLRGNHTSILPYKEAIEKAIYDEKFTKIRTEYRDLDDKAFSIANRFDEYKSLTKEEAEEKYNELKPELEKLRNKRNEYVVDIVEKERRRINGPKEIAKGIYEIIPHHTTHEKIGEIYQEYMNFNSNNGTIIYSMNLSSLMPADKPDIVKISDYIGMIDKYGIDKVNGANEFKKFITKYPDIYNEGINNENEKEDEQQIEEVEEAI